MELRFHRSTLAAAARMTRHRWPGYPETPEQAWDDYSIPQVKNTSEVL